MSEELTKEFKELGETLYMKFGSDSYPERCVLFDLTDKVKEKDKEIEELRDLITNECENGQLYLVAMRTGQANHEDLANVSMHFNNIEELLK